MKTFKRILIPIDFSTHSEEALDVAFQLAGTDPDMEIFVCHAVEEINYHAMMGFGVPPRPVSEADRTQVANQVMDTIVKLKTTRDLTKNYLVRPGAASDVILDAAKEKEIDLIVMGTHGRSGLTRLLMGSIAEKIVRDAPCAVLTVKAEEEAT